MKYVKNEKKIEDINIDTGVTAEQLYHHLTTIVRTIPETKFLDDEQIMSVVTDTTVAVHQQMVNGKVPNDNYDAFRSYLFFALRNNIFRENKKKTYMKNIPITKSCEIDETVEESVTTTNSALSKLDKNDLNKLIQSKLKSIRMKPRIMEYIQFVVKHGSDFDSVAEMERHYTITTGKNTPDFYALINSLKEKFNTQITYHRFDQHEFDQFNDKRTKIKYLWKCGYSNVEIAKMMGVSSSYVSNIIRKD
jgi:transcriptional regulator